MRHASNAPVRTLASLLVIAAFGVAASPSPAQTGPATDLADWVTVDGATNVATGTLRGASVALTGTDVGPGSVTDETFTGFATANFSPPVPETDAVGIVVTSGSSFTLTFGAPLKDPVLHLASFGSTFEFPAGTVISKVSGEPGLTVSGSSVMGAEGPGVGQAGDANGTVQLTGTFSSLPFTANPIPGAPNGDGLYLQVGARVPVTPPPPTPPPAPPPAPPPPPALVERNVTRPSIGIVRRLASSAVYRCNAGSWEGLPTSPRFDYRWFRAGTLSGTISNFRQTPDVLVASSAEYTLPQADYGKRYFCAVSVPALSGRTLTAYSQTTVLTGREMTVSDLLPSFYGDVRIRGIDIFQVVQPISGATMYGWPSGPFLTLCGGGTPTAFTRCDTVPADPQRVGYAGVPLDQRKPATAIVFVDMNDVSASDAAQQLDVVLSARVGGRQLSGSITRRLANPVRTTTPWVTAAERVGPSGMSFPVPAAWLASAVLSRQPLSLEATVSVPVGAGSGTLRECPKPFVQPGVPNCLSNNRFRLDSITVLDNLPELTIRSLPLVTTDQTTATLASPESVLRAAVKLYPGGERLTILPYVGSISIDAAANLQATDSQCKPFVDKKEPALPAPVRSCRAAFVKTEIDDWIVAAPQNSQGHNILMAVHRYGIPAENGRGATQEPGAASGNIGTGQVPIMHINDGSLGRPLTAAAHEFGHVVGLPHADSDFPGPPSSGCGGNSNGQVGESWLPDGQGRLQGVGFERVSRFGGASFHRFRSDGLGSFFDLMSYCASDAAAWLSARNWIRSFAFLREHDSRQRRGAGAASASVRAASARSAQAGQGLARGVLGPNGGRIVHVVPAGSGATAPAADPSSQVRVRALGAGGNVLGEAGAVVRELQDVEGAATFVAPVPAGAQAVELISGATTLDRAERSRPPTVGLSAPRRGLRVAAKTALAVRWTAADPDGGELRARIDYAPDGRSWRTVFQGPSTGRASIPGRSLEAGSGARVRVTVDDGFNIARAVSQPFEAAGTGPSARIVVPDTGDALQAGRTLLVGSARDERARPLRGRALTWFAGSRRLGTGERLTAQLPAGRIAVRLRVRDARGRVAVATRRLLVAPVAMRLRTLRAPERVGARAAYVSVRIATTTAATLRAGGRRFAVGARTRTVRIPLPSRPRSGVLKIVLTLTAQGPRQPALRETIIVVRR